MIKKVEDSIDINRIKDRSIEIKDAIMTNLTPLNQQDLTSRLKSFSGYQLNTAYNNLTKFCGGVWLSGCERRFGQKFCPHSRQIESQLRQKFSVMHNEPLSRN